ncbi:hypothetical protein [Cellulomonas marina]|uniref:EcsC protein family protein n=1 Tax=Cellulomonas marina TaxID=988821 RepID=A0A1I1AME5_9CELL|nr:hypothetical protein [Cellulomonas marina]GIG30437.1 hypothetical protein Cma02nite_30370 [Cellulomonas marina]SFB39194.1 hypothetical protein SAMN05421867_12029 [Cellulomonas marina]
MSLLDQALDKAVEIPSARIDAHVAALRRRNPEADPARVVELLEKEYLLLVQGAGGAVGAAAAVPGVGTGTAMALTVGDVGTFLAASAAFSLAVASVHGIGVEDKDRRRALLLTTVLGEEGASTVGDALGVGGAKAARQLLTRMPASTVRNVNTRLAKRLIKRQAAKQGGLVLGRLVPFGVGAAVGVAGARALGRTVVEGARAAFGPPPARFPTVLEVVPTSTARRLGGGADDATPVQRPSPLATPPSDERDGGVRGLLSRLRDRDGR